MVPEPPGFDKDYSRCPLARTESSENADVSCAPLLARTVQKVEQANALVESQGGLPGDWFASFKPLRRHGRRRLSNASQDWPQISGLEE